MAETQYGSTIGTPGTSGPKYDPLINSDTDSNGSFPENFQLESPNVNEPKGCLARCMLFPKTVFLIVGNEFCERFSFYGMRTVLVLYMMNILKYSDDDATAIFHGFIVLCYSAPIIGSILADGFIGKYHTILWLSLLYSAGNLTLAVSSAFSKSSHYHPTADILSLLVIALGTGGIKPCVSAFGGDQFTRNQESLLEAFFSFFYFAINAGALISTFITPYFRVMKCNHEESCYPAAFGLPAVLMIISVGLFAVGTPWYRRNPPKDNIIFEFVKTIYKGIRNFIVHRMHRKHWLDHYFDDHDCEADRLCSDHEECQKVTLVEDIKQLLKICVMFMPLPMFWALFDQQGSRWIIQGISMDTKISEKFSLLPDQMPTLNAFMIVLFIPVFQALVYPLAQRGGISLTPLKKMSFGGFLAAGAYLCAMLVQIAVNKSIPNVPKTGEMHLSFINLLDCDAVLKSNGTGPIKIAANEIHQIQIVKADDASSIAKYLWSIECAEERFHTNFSTPFEQKKAFYTLLMKSTIVSLPFTLKKPSRGRGESRLYVNFVPENTTLSRNVRICNARKEDSCISSELTEIGAEHSVLLKPGKYLLKSEAVRSPVNFEMPGQGAVNSLTLTTNNAAGKRTEHLHTLVPENGVSILWQIPQYALLTAGEVMFSITGLEFSYSQAPESLKSVVQACWLMTVAFGNIIVLLVAKAQYFDNLAHEFLLFAVLMSFVMLIFSALAGFWYKYVDTDGKSKKTRQESPPKSLSKNQ